MNTLELIYRGEVLESYTGVAKMAVTGHLYGYAENSEMNQLVFPFELGYFGIVD